MMKVVLALMLGSVAALSTNNRRTFLKTAAAGAVAVTPLVAFADVDYAGLPYLGGSNKVDINNANVRVYVKMPGSLLRPESYFLLSLRVPLFSRGSLRVCA